MHGMIVTAAVTVAIVTVTARNIHKCIHLQTN